MHEDCLENILQDISNVTHNYIDNNLLSLYKYNFDKKLLDYIKANIKVNVPEKNLDKYINIFLRKFYKSFMPKRSYLNNKSKKLPNKEKIKKIIDHIKNMPQPEQRTESWYKFRHNLITASNAYKAFGSDAKKNELICEKCKEFEYPISRSINIETAMHWGVRYEPLSVMYYENKYNTKIDDYGCIQHEKYKFLGASPDGINVDSSSNLYGRMLEIKNPKSRTITGIPKDEYWVQMQLQMEVCNLNYCDFLETKFTEYTTREEFITDGSFNLSSDNKLKGIIMHFSKNNEVKYFYKPIDYNEEEYNVWELEQMNLENDGYLWIQNIYWKLDYVSCILVLRNKRWFNKCIKYIEDIWKTVEEERINNKWHDRKAKKRVKIENPSLNKNNALIINIDTS